MPKTEKTMLYENKKMRQALFLYELFENDDFEEKLLAASAGFSTKKQNILQMYYADFVSIDDIAEFYQMSRTQIRQILRECLNKIKQSPARRYFEYGVELKEAADLINEKIRDNAAMLIWLNQTEHILDHIAEEGDQKIEDSDLSDVQKRRLLGAQYDLIKDITSLDVKRLVEKIGQTIPDMPCFDQIPIEAMGFSARTYNCLNRGGCHTLGDICEMTKDQLLRIRNMGVSSAQEVIDVVGKYGRSLRES